MTDSSPSECPRCGAALPADATDPLCPACLVSGAINATGPAPIAPEPDEFPCRFGNYRLLGMLGRGGMGTVYEALDLATERRVALKRLGLELDTPEMRRRFLREGRLAAGVSHPNSLFIYGSEEIDGVPVITMEVAASGTLKDRIDERGPFPVKEGVDAVLDVIDGLEAACEAGVLHRDIKPSNCFTSPDGSVKIGDFGLSVSTLAREDSHVTATGVILGTPAYASPEQLRGDDLDPRSDIYSVGATLFTLLTGRVPFEGSNAIQVVANALNRDPIRLGELSGDVPSGLEKVVNRCLAKRPEDRYGDYRALRDALLPFSSREPEPANLAARGAAGWIDYLVALLLPYAPLAIVVGGEDFHITPLIERTLGSARYYLAVMGLACLYFGLAEGILGAGLGKRIMGLRVIRRRGHGTPGFFRGAARFLIPMALCEGVRIPLLLALVKVDHIDEMTGFQVGIFFALAMGCPWIPVILSFFARPGNGFATLWDLLSGTRVICKPTGTVRPRLELDPAPEGVEKDAGSLGPFRITETRIPGAWLLAWDPMLRRRVWLLARAETAPSPQRRSLARPGRMRWLQAVTRDGETWDAFEAPPGAPLASVIEHCKSIPWGTMRHWLHDLAGELWAASRDGTLPDRPGLDHVWITTQGRALLLDTPWADPDHPAETFSVTDLAGQQRFLSAVASPVDAARLPLHAGPLLANLEAGKYRKLSFLTGTLRGVLDRSAGVSRGTRAGSMFMIPLYAWFMTFIGSSRGAEWLYAVVGESLPRIALASAVAVLAAAALIQFLGLPFRTTASLSLFRLALVDARGAPAGLSRRLARWAVVWLPLVLPLTAILAPFREFDTRDAILATITILVWIAGAAHALLRPDEGFPDRLSRTRVVGR